MAKQFRLVVYAALLWSWLWFVPAAAHFYYGGGVPRLPDAADGLAMTAMLVAVTVGIRSRSWRRAVILVIAAGVMLGGLVEIGTRAATGGDIDGTIVAAIVDTTFGEATEMIGSQLSRDALAFVICLVVPAVGFLVACLRSADPDRSSRRWAGLACVVVVLITVPARAAISAALDWRHGRPNHRRVVDRLNPVATYDGVRALFSIGSGLLTSLRHRSAPVEDVGPVTSVEPQPAALIVVVGESLTRHHMSLYGYGRETTPRLAAMASRLIVFPDVISPHVYTSASLGHAFSIGLDRADPLRGPTIFQALSGSFDTRWISNISPLGLGESSEARVTRTVPTRVWLNNVLVWDFWDRRAGRSYDEKVLEPMAAALATPGRHAIFVHLSGSHIEYSRRSPPEFKVFSGPVAALPARQASDVNEYDNSVYYNDYVVTEIIRRIEAMNMDASVLYFSDHGDEQYAFRGQHGHNEVSISRYMTDIPFMLWVSERFRSLRPGLVEQIIKARNTPAQLTDLSFALAELAGIRFSGWTPTRSLFSSEYVSPSRFVKGIPYEQILPNPVPTEGSASSGR